MKYYVVRYEGPFGFIKPWTAVRDGETFSQQFLTPSIVAGMERKLFPRLLTKPFGHYKVLGHRLSYAQMTAQQEQIQPRGWNKKRQHFERPYAILTRSVLLNPVLHLAFEEANDAEIAMKQHLCLCRNEDLLYPVASLETTKESFEQNGELFNGYELVFEMSSGSFMVGYNRFDQARAMYGCLRVVGNPVKELI